MQFIYLEKNSNNLKRNNMKNIHVLPTDKPSRLFIDVDDNKLKICVPLGGEHMMNQHIYITSSEEIKEGDWIFNGEREPSILQCIGRGSLRDWKKIILTTDQELDGVQTIQDDFLEWFVKNPSCEFVEVVKEMYMPQSNGKISDGKITHELSLNESLNTLPFYRIIIPKQEQADIPNPAEDLIQSLRLLTDTFTHNELESIIEQLYYVKSQEKLEYYFDQIKLNASQADIISAFQYGYFDTLSAMGEI